MEERQKNLPRVVGDVMPPPVPGRGSYLRMLLSRAEPGAVRYTRVEQWEIVGTQPARFPAIKRTRLTLATGAVSLVAITALTTWWLTAETPPPPRNPGVTVSLPASNASPRPAPQQAVAAQPPQLAAIVTAPAAVAAAPEAEPSATPRTERAALGRAFATNESWPWQGKATRGMVVVGPGEIVDGRLCRDVAIMTRGEGIPDRTANSRKCQEPGGAIVEAGSTE